MPTYLIYPIYTTAILIITYTLVPRREIRHLFRYGIIFGGVIDAAMIILFTKIVGLGGYINYGPFAFKGIPFFPLISWSGYFISYLYLLPQGKAWGFVFPLISALYSVLFSNILENLGLFKWNWGTLFIPFIIYAVWHFTVTWVYLRIRSK